ncbi:L-lactate permease [Gordonia sp. SL306]|uniref:L-lactate permease n=1 Tax=Gordonia sp. SL306 TaxID=2995145 RepID=UPI00226FCDE3|nr:lactate permease LctP family transporter [Gordonia sp. SL306]WAC58302.1 lactate permease LctP family transporter [Gordonia sp. SL306]
MWDQNYAPYDSVYLSALVGAIPILVFLLGLVALKLKGVTAATISAVIAALVALIVFGMPLPKIVGAALYGAVSGLWPIAWIIVMAVWLYKIAVKSGQFTIIRTSIGGISNDQRIQVLLIAFCFGGLLEGAAGFGVPIAICAALLVELGFRPVKAAMLCLVANAGAGAYGAIGIPVIQGAKVGEVDLGSLSDWMIPVIQGLTALLPLILIAILDGWKGIRHTWPAWLLTGVVFSGTQCLVLWLAGPELTDILPPLLAMVALAGLTRIWQPSEVYREAGATAPDTTRYSVWEVIKAWSPFYFLTGAILVWSVTWFKNLFVPGGALDFTVLNIHMPWIDGTIVQHPPVSSTSTPLAAIWQVSLIGASGTAVLAAILVTGAFARITVPQALDQLRATISELWKPIVLILLVLMLAYISNLSGATAAIGLALANVGEIFPLVSPVIGWIGVFITGSVVNNNTLFAKLQAVTAHQLGIDPTLLVASNTGGGTMAKLVSAQSIAIAAAAVGETGNESSILRSTLKYSLVFLAVVCVTVFVLSLIA